MSKELVIGSNRHETKVAILEEDQLVEVYFQRGNEYSLAGSIHKGRVTRVLPGMQSAFVDLGLERDTFLYVSDFFEENEEFDRIPATREESGPERRPRSQEEPTAADESAAPLETGVEVSDETAETAPAVAVAPLATPPQERQEDGDGRDRRGRRPRRRRNRGRGFPESKYASADSRYASEPSRETTREPRERPRELNAVEAAPTEELSSRPSAAPSSGSDFAVLPGESLAKYTRSNIQPLDEAEEEEIRG